MTVENASNVTDTTYTGTVHFTSSDTGASTLLPANATLVAGVGTFNATLTTAGSQTLSATDTVNPGVTGSAAITVTAGTATHLVVIAPTTAVAGTAISFTVQAEDQFNNLATSYADSVHFTSSDVGASTVLPANSGLTGGVGTFNATLTTAGSQTIAATDTVTSSLTATSGPITVSAAAASHFTVNAPGTATSGVSFSFTVTAEDKFNNTATGYAGTVVLSSSDNGTFVPPSGPLTNGTGVFNGTLKTVGLQTITATDSVSSAITGASNPITVSAGVATHFTVSAPATAAAGTGFGFTVTAEDANNNTATSYSGNVHFTSSDVGASTLLPANSGLTNGVGTFNATLTTAGSQTLIATDTFTSTIKGASGPIVVSAAAATHFAVTAPAVASPGFGFGFTVTAEDQFNNTATSYAGTVKFATTDSGASVTLPANSPLANGVGTFSATLQTNGNQILSATDTANSSITGNTTINVSNAVATHFLVSAPPAPGRAMPLASRSPPSRRATPRSPATPAPSTSPAATPRRISWPTT